MSDTKTLALDGLTKAFGPTVAVDNVSLDFPLGQTTAIIGPNGAGKTTLFNLITGKLSPTSGTIKLGDERIDGKKPSNIVKQGIIRSFQITNIFSELSVLENVRLAAQSTYSGIRPSRYTSHYKKQDEIINDAHAVLKQVGLHDVAEEKAGALSHGHQRHLDIGIALATNPKILLLDEPTAGMSPAETEETTNLISSLAQELTIILVEHDMDVVMDVSDEIAVLNNGSLLASGAPSDVRSNKKVQEAYLGGGVIQ